LFGVYNFPDNKRKTGLFKPVFYYCCKLSIKINIGIFILFKQAGIIFFHYQGKLGHREQLARIAVYGNQIGGYIFDLPAGSIERYFFAAGQVEQYRSEKICYICFACSRGMFLDFILRN
jgi:hypothetical protein